MKVGIAIDKWKRAAFEEALKLDGFTFEVKEFIAGTLMIKVETTPDKLYELSRTVRGVNKMLAHKGTKH